MALKTTFHQLGGVRVVECLGTIDSTADALELISACAEHDATRVLLEDRHLPAAFFELRSGFAGEFIQKIVNYRMLLAVVFTNVPSHGERFEQFVTEARRGRSFRAFDDRSSAATWLASG